MIHPTAISICEFVASAYSFLIPFGDTWTGAKLAEAMTAYYDNEAVRIDARFATNYIVTITRSIGDRVTARFIV